MPDPVDALILDLLEWIGPRPRPYREVLEAWRTSCPRLPDLALFAIGATIVWSAVAAFLNMTVKGIASIDDILLLFIYLELGAMVGIYFKTNHMPVRFLIYVAITALTRLLIMEVQMHQKPDLSVIYVTSAILILALATFVIRYGSHKFPSGGGDEMVRK